MFLQPGVPTSFTFTIGWVDIIIVLVLVITFLRARSAFTPVLILVILLYIIRLFPNQIIDIVQTINKLNGPAAFITISR
jgi:hypothetical protein